MNLNKHISVAFFLFFLLTYFSNLGFAQSNKKTIVEGQKVLVHQVYFWLKPNLSPNEFAKFEKGVRSLLSIKSMKFGSVGIPAPTPNRPVIDTTYSYSLLTIFQNIADHDAYQIDPIHEQFLKDCKDLWIKVLVYDSNNF